MHLSAHAVSDHFPHHGKSVFFGVLLHFIPDVAERSAVPEVFHRLEKTFLRHVDQLLFLCGDLSHVKAARRVADKPVFHRAYVDADDHIGLYDALFVRNAVHDHIFERYARAGGIPVISQKRGFRTAILNVFECDLIEREGAHALFHAFFKQIEHVARYAARLAHQFDFFRGFDFYHKLSRTFSTSAKTSFTALSPSTRRSTPSLR